MVVDQSEDRAAGWQRTESALIAVGIVVAVIAWGQPWWLLLAAFLVFDLSALGYLAGPRVGAVTYNLVHNYAAPAALITAWAALLLADVEHGAGADWMVLLAACWAFHVAVDRALGFGLKVGTFGHTHLGVIGAAARADVRPQ